MRHLYTSSIVHECPNIPPAVSARLERHVACALGFMINWSGSQATTTVQTMLTSQRPCTTTALCAHLATQVLLYEVRQPGGGVLNSRRIGLLVGARRSERATESRGLGWEVSGQALALVPRRSDEYLLYILPSGSGITDRVFLPPTGP